MPDRVFFGVCLVTSNSYNVRNVNTDGTLSNTNAYNGNNGARPLWWIPPNEYARALLSSKARAENSGPLSKEGISLRRGESAAVNTRLVKPGPREPASARLRARGGVR